MIEQTAAFVCADAVSRFGCIVHEVRLQIPTGALIRRQPKRIRVVVECPDAVSLALVRAVVEQAGGTIEGNPARLGLGIPCPDGDVLSFSLPYHDGAQGLFPLGR